MGFVSRNCRYDLWVFCWEHIHFEIPFFSVYSVLTREARFVPDNPASPSIWKFWNKSGLKWETKRKETNFFSRDKDNKNCIICGEAKSNKVGIELGHNFPFIPIFSHLPSIFSLGVWLSLPSKFNWLSGREQKTKSSWFLKVSIIFSRT